MTRRGLSEVGSSATGLRKGSGEVPMSLTIVRKYPGILNEEERGPELPSPRSAAPRSGAVRRLREKLSSRPRPRQSPLLPRACPGWPLVGGHSPSEPAGMYLRDRESRPRLGRSSGEGGTCERRSCQGAEAEPKGKGPRGSGVYRHRWARERGLWAGPRKNGLGDLNVPTKPAVPGQPRLFTGW